MRLLIVTQYFWPENFRINDLAAEMVARGHEVTVLTGVPNYPDGHVFSDYARDPARFFSFKGADLVRVPLVPRGRNSIQLLLNYLSFVFTASTIGIWKLRRRKFDAIFTYQASPVTVGLPAILLRKLKNAPMAMWILDVWPDTLHALGVVRSRLVLKVVGRLASFIYKRCDLILVQSRGFVGQIASRSPGKKSVVYFSSWAEGLFGVTTAPPAPEVPAAPGCFNVMFAGNIGESQDFPSVLDAAERLKTHKRIRWLIVGDGRMAEWVQREVVRRGLQDTFILLGRYPVERMPAFFQLADVLLVSLRDEPIFSMTIPGKVQSYLAAGKPVVAMLNGEGAEIIQRSQAGVACGAGNPEALAEAVLRLSRLSREELDVMGENALAFSAQEFDRTTLMGRLENLLQGMRSRA